MENQQKPQTPQGQLPDHRFDELQAKLRKIELENQQLRGHIDAMSQRQPQAPQEEETGFKPEVAQQLEKFIRRHIEPLQNEFKNSLGMLYDSQDEARFQIKYGGDRWAKFHPKVEQLRQEMQAQNKWITREQALQMVYFEETGKKPAPEQPKIEEQKPVYDPYFQAYVDPVTKLPIDPSKAASQPNTVQDEIQFQPPPPSHQPPQAQQWQPQWQQAPQQPPPQQMVPGGYGPAQKPHPGFSLPDQGVNTQHVPAHQQSRSAREITIDSSDADLEAFERTMGDIPF